MNPFTFSSLFISLLLFKSIQNASAANILFFNAVGSHSTRISMWPLLEALSDKGHNITYLSSFEDTTLKNSKITQIVPKKLQQFQGADAWEKDQSFFERRKDPWNIVKLAFDIRQMSIFACENLYSDPDILNWIKSKETNFDVIIPEAGWNHCAYGLVHYWKTKLVIYGTTTVLPYMNEAFGLPDESSYVGDMMMGYPTSKLHPMSFGQRFLNAFSPIIYTWTREWTYFSKLEEITRRGLGLQDEELPRFVDIETNTSLILLTTHFSFGVCRSFPPNIKTVGGVVFSKKLKPLSDEMEEFINSAKQGFIFISFGTVTEFTNFDNDVQKEFIAALRSFPDMKFVWKSRQPIKYALPDNVLVAEWAPQQTLLAHPNIKAFITHSGTGSSLEAVHFQVPMVCLPVLADQNLNADMAEEKGVGIKLEILTLKKEELQQAIQEILHNPKFRQNMKKISALFKDRPRPPLEESVWWIEYVLRHDNLHEILMPASVYQSWWQKRQIDIWLTAGLLALILLIFPLAVICLAIKKVILEKKKIKQN